MLNYMAIVYLNDIFGDIYSIIRLFDDDTVSLTYWQFIRHLSSVKLHLFYSYVFEYYFSIKYPLILYSTYCTSFTYIVLTFHLIDTPFNAFANTADPDQAAF